MRVCDQRIQGAKFAGHKFHCRLFSAKVLVSLPVNYCKLPLLARNLMKARTVVKHTAIYCLTLTALVSLALVNSWAAEGSHRGAATVDFNKEIRPVLTENCFKCHGPDEGARKSKLRFDLRDAALKPAKSGKIAIVPGSPEKSEMMSRVTTSDEDDRMPPLKTGKKLSPAQVESLRQWIAQGAPYATHWSYVKPLRPPLPEVKNKRWSRNPLDRFILARLESQGLKPSPRAENYTLIRRVSLDLTGLPPTVEQADEFERDHAKDAYEKLVDRLLASSAFGEHWARMWLDLARYADSAGYADDPPRMIWAFRDWVIRAFNANMPFDRFTIEQIAGDLLDHPDEDDLIATAFHRNTMTNNEGGTTDEEFRNAAVVDRVNTTMAVWMAASMGCAQCHNHKYDPITQHDYFSLFAILNNTADADLTDESPVLPLYTAQQKQDQKRLDEEIAALEKQVKTATPESLANEAKWEQRFPGEHQWQLLKPTFKSAKEGGRIVQSDQEALEIAPLQKTETYTLELPFPATRLSGVRFDLMASLGKTNSEELANGGFEISHVNATVIAPESNRPLVRYVRIELPGKEKILSLAEVQVFHGKENVALRGEATQSSTAFDAPARLAIDGQTDGDFGSARSTTHTAISENPWWELDLKDPQLIDSIVLWNRTDHDLQSRLSDFRIHALDTNRKTVWEQSVKEPPNPTKSFGLDGSVSVQFTAAFTDTSQTAADLKSLFDRKSKKKGWTLDAGDQKWHHLTLLPAEPVEVHPGSRVQITVGQNALHDHCPPALLRVSASDDERITDYAGVPDSLLQALITPPANRAEQQQTALSEYYRANVDPGLKPQRERLAQLKKQLAAIQPNTVPIFRELTGDKRRKTHIQFRGNYLALGDEVTEALPTSLFGLPNNSEPNRLSLARWLVDKDNPLTARVVVNRFWEQIFGLGIVRTCEDFGSQGDRPTNPELLDWLATEFIARNWDVKSMLKLLVTSATYCQSSRVTPQLQERDPENLLLARGPRFRVPAEIIRDQTLAVSGLLSHKMYGPPVRPPQPPFGLKAAFCGNFYLKTREGEDRYRRALYIGW